MKNLRRYIRSMLFEGKIAKAMSPKLFAKKLDIFAKEMVSEEPWGQATVFSVKEDSNMISMNVILMPFAPYQRDENELYSYSSSMEYAKEQMKNIDPYTWLKEMKEKYTVIFDTFSNRRGWNVLKAKFQLQPGFSLLIEYTFDMMASKENTNYFGQSDQLFEQGWRLFHLTKSSNVPKILKTGIKPSRVSSDMVRFGSGRSYYILTKGNDSEVTSFFKEMMKRPGYAGIHKAEQSVFEIDLDNDLNLKFYIDTEFFGTGIITWEASEYHAVWTPSHVPAKLLTRFM